MFFKHDTTSDYSGYEISCQLRSINDVCIEIYFNNKSSNRERYEVFSENNGNVYLFVYINVVAFKILPIR